MEGISVRDGQDSRIGWTASWPGLAAIIGLPLLALLAATRGLGLPGEALLGDPATVMGQPPYIGLFSNIGVLAWWTAAVACLFAASLLPPLPMVPRRMLLAAGLISALFAIDDMAMLHEQVLPRLTGIGENRIFACYGAAICWYAFQFRRQHRVLDAALLACTLLLLGSSAVVDLTLDNLPRLRWPLLPLLEALAGADAAHWVEGTFMAEGSHLADRLGVMEDGAKFIGTIAWASYHLRLARLSLVGQVAPAATAARPGNWPPPFPAPIGSGAPKPAMMQSPPRRSPLRASRGR